MALHDPVAVYNAANNVEAHLLRNVLGTAGIEAFAMEDFSEIHKPQVWVERADIHRVKPILDDYERRAGDLRDIVSQDEVQAESEIETLCEECGARAAFPASQLGSVQQCQNCGAYVDVESEKGPEE